MPSQQHLNKDETGQLISADKVDGTAVYNATGDKLGSVDHVMIDKFNGRVAYAVMSFGGFLGMGNKYHPLPWSVLKYDTQQDGYVVNLDKKVLEGAPVMEDADVADWDNRAWGQQIHNYYHVPPYWL